MSEERLREYVDKDKIYQKYKDSDIEPIEFERFCFVHCKDIENILEELKQLREENERLKFLRDEYTS